MILESVLVTCIAWNVYFEAGGEPPAGQRAVAEVTLRRTAMRPGGESACHAVFDGVAFSWTVLIENPTVNYNSPQWRDAVEATRAALAGSNDSLGADHYHADYIRPPRWARNGKLCEVTRIGRHVFYKPCEAAR